jgi:mannitol 2-dehydrogenase
MNVDGEIDTRLEPVQRDLEHPSDPNTAAAFIAGALALRCKSGGGPLTVMSCDNIPANGRVLESCVLFFCRELYPEIVNWVEDQVSFPASMVDRITPVTTPELVKELEDNYGVADRWPVCCEDFRQWVLEDKFKTRVPCYGEAGVQIVKDAGPYELMKMRLLNGSHSAMAYISWLLGLRMVDESINHPLVSAFIRRKYMEEITPTLKPVPGIDLDLYKDTLISRFSNRNIADTIARLAAEGASKIPNFILKPLSEAIKRQLPCEALVFALAGWARFLEGTDEQGRPIPLDDPNGQAVAGAAKKAASDPAGFLTAAGIEAGELSPAQLKFAAEKLRIHLAAIHGKGIKRALEEAAGNK